MATAVLETTGRESKPIKVKGVERFLSRYFGDRAGFLLKQELRKAGIGNTESVPLLDRERLIELIVADLLSAKMGVGRLTMARAELMSLLGIEVDGSKSVGTYISKPREHVLTKEMQNEFKKMSKYFVYQEILKNNLKDIDIVDYDTKVDIMESILRKQFGDMAAFVVERKMCDLGLYQDRLSIPMRQMLMEQIIGDNLAVYMNSEDAKTVQKEINDQLRLNKFKVKGIAAMGRGDVKIEITSSEKNNKKGGKAVEQTSIMVKPLKFKGIGTSMSGKVKTPQDLNVRRAGMRVGSLFVLNYQGDIRRKALRYFNDTLQLLTKYKKSRLSIRDMKSADIAAKGTILEEIMKYYFGWMSRVFLSKEMDRLGITDIESASNETKIKLIDHIIKDCLSVILSPAEVNEARKRLMESMGIKT